jgi:hypothetical protein
MTRAAVARVLAASVVAALALTGCTMDFGAPAPSVSASPAPSESPVAAPVLDPASASASRPYFDQTVTAVLAGRPDAGGQEIIDALVAAGFDKAAMQVGYDRTPTGLAVDSLQFSVLLAGECLIGQRGTGGTYSSLLAPALGTGGCLIGAGRPIDW